MSTNNEKGVKRQMRQNHMVWGSEELLGLEITRPKTAGRHAFYVTPSHAVGQYRNAVAPSCRGCWITLLGQNAVVTPKWLSSCYGPDHPNFGPTVTSSGPEPAPRTAGSDCTSTRHDVWKPWYKCLLSSLSLILSIYMVSPET